jgi:trans-2,3-dihydro-3-hydroxyanthranilate isomerase
MSRITFYIADVFAEEKYAGNQLAIVRGAAHLPDAEMQKIALEMNYSETTFIISEEERRGGYDVRIFTPREEISFAGHPTLGTAYVIRTEILHRPIERVTLNLKAGRIPVTFGDVLWMEQLPPTFGRVLEPGPLARVLSIAEDELDTRYPIQEVSTGLPFILVPLRNLAALKRCRVNRDAYHELVESAGARSIFVFAPEPHEETNDLAARMFADYFGIPEDPATGSAAGCLAGYLVEHRYLGSDPISVRVEQGYEIGRPSLLRLCAERREDRISVSVGGKVRLAAKGELL